MSCAGPFFAIGRQEPRLRYARATGPAAIGVLFGGPGASAVVENEVVEQIVERPARHKE
jgi:hypothetical protein